LKQTEQKKTDGKKIEKNHGKSQKKKKKKLIVEDKISNFQLLEIQ